MQVLSESVANALKKTGDDEVTETIRFVDMMDKLFDVFNVNSYDTGKKKRKPFQDPYRSADDVRVKVHVFIILQHAVLIYMICCVTV